MRIVIRGASEIEIEITEKPGEPTPGAAERAPVCHDTAGSSAANPLCGSRDEPAGKSSTVKTGSEAHVNRGCRHAMGTLGSDREAMVAVATEPAVMALDPSREATTVIGTAGNQSGPHDTLPTVLDEPTVAALMAKVGDQVRAAVANPPPPVERPAELDLKRPPVGEDTLDIPAFLDRRRGRVA